MSQTLDYKTPATRPPLNRTAVASLVIGIIGFPVCYILGALTADHHSRYPGDVSLCLLLAAEFVPPLVTIILRFRTRAEMLKSPDSAAFRPSLYIASAAIACAFIWSALPIMAAYFGWVNLC